MEKTKKIIALKQNYLFGKAYDKGKCFAQSTIAVYILKDYRHGATRFGITVSKKRGGAVERNRAKRVIREAFRHLRPYVKDGYIIVVVARQACMKAPCAVVEGELEEVLKKAALLAGKDV